MVSLHHWSEPQGSKGKKENTYKALENQTLWLCREKSWVLHQHESSAAQSAWLHRGSTSPPRGCPLRACEAVDGISMSWLFLPSVRPNTRGIRGIHGNDLAPAKMLRCPFSPLIFLFLTLSFISSLNGFLLCLCPPPPSFPLWGLFSPFFFCCPKQFTEKKVPRNNQAAGQPESTPSLPGPERPNVDLYASLITKNCSKNKTAISSGRLRLKMHFCKHIEPKRLNFLDEGAPHKAPVVRVTSCAPLPLH